MAKFRKSGKRWKKIRRYRNREKKVLLELALRELKNGQKDSGKVVETVVWKSRGNSNETRTTVKVQWLNTSIRWLSKGQ